MALPRDRGVLLSTASYEKGSFQTGVAVLDLRSGKTRGVLKDTGFARYMPPGYLLFTRRGTLLGVRFDLAKLETRGEPVALMDGLFHDPEWSDARFDVSRDGTLCYRPGAVDASLTRLVTVDAGGRASEWSPMRAGFETWFRVAPDGRRVACTMASPKSIFEVFVLERGRSSARRLSGLPDADCGTPFWSPDGREIGFTRFGRSPDDGLYVVEASGMGAPRRIGVAPKGSADVLVAQGSWSRDGSMVVASIGMGPMSANLAAIPMVSAGPDIPIRTLTDTPYGETQPAVSPDGRFVAYLSGESGRDEVVLSPLLPGPKLGPTTPVSSGGASDVRWGRDGSSLYYESADHRIQSVPVRTSPTLQVGTPRTVWDLSALRIASKGWDLMPDGRLIGLQMREDEGEGKQIDLVMHFDQEVKRKIPR
jgi:hypothetical protein